MDDYLVHAKTAMAMAYSSSLTLIAADWLRVLDTHASAFGVAIGVSGLIINIYFQRENIKIQRLKIDEQNGKE